MKDELLENAEETCRQLTQKLEEVTKERDILIEVLDCVSSNMYELDECVEMAVKALKEVGYA